MEEYVTRVEHPIKPKFVSSGPCKENILLGEKARADILPIVTHAEGDVAPFITAGMVTARGSGNRVNNVSFNRMHSRARRNSA